VGVGFVSFDELVVFLALWLGDECDECDEFFTSSLRFGWLVDGQSTE